MLRSMARPPVPAEISGRVVETRGRRVAVRHTDGESVCFLSGHRAVVGDEVRFVDAEGGGGKVTAVLARRTELARVDFKGKPQVLAANLAGLLVVVAPREPPFRAGLVDRYLVAAGMAGLDVAVCVNKVDQGVPDTMERELAARAAHGLRVVRTSASTGEGVDALADLLREVSVGGPWALVGHSGVGKTSVIGALLPGQEVGPIGHLSEYWGTGQHTTTHSRLFTLPRGGEIADSPGIRTFTPAGLDVDTVRGGFPGVVGLRCKYRDCQHRDGEEGCVAEAQVDPELLVSYRRLLEDVRSVGERSRPGGKRHSD